MSQARSTRSRLDPLRRRSGAFAMLAVDQREALRVMMTESLGAASPVDDEAVVDFKLTAARLLTPHASAVLIDRQFAWDAAIAAGVVADRCGLISSGDHFVPAHGQLVGEVEIDRRVDPLRVRDQGATAMKLLVLHRPDQSPDGRRAMVDEFVGICDRAGLASIIEPVCRPALDPTVDWHHDDAIIAAADELGSRGADLYKGEMPLRGSGDENEMRQRCRAITATVGSPWVILSSGVDEDDFPDAVRLACEEGASGFLAGRAVWASCLGADDIAECLRGPATRRLREFAAIADHVMSERAPGAPCPPPS